jgi:5-amino-6-(5-phospho-D-ribitylamino)uracil phosphatase
MISKEILRRIKLVVFDLDGTLVDDQNQIGEEIKQLIYELSGLGVLFSIATGRLISAVVDHADELKIDIPLITLDGTLIQRRPGEKSIFEAHLKKKTVKRTLKLADQYFLKAALCHDKAIYFTQENSHLPQVINKFGAKYQWVSSYNNYLDNTLEVILVGENASGVRQVAKKMSFPFTIGVRSAYYKSQSQGGNYYLEIRRLGCSKGDGLKKLIKHLHLKMKNAAVIGDWYNDKSLFENDSLKIAIANAVPELKRMADIILKKTNNEGGVSEFLKMLLDAKKS